MTFAEPEFKPTHRLTAFGNTFMVMEIESVLYTKEEFEGILLADYVIEGDCVTFQGRNIDYTLEKIK